MKPTKEELYVMYWNRGMTYIEIARNPNWKGRIKRCNGYIKILLPNHPRSDDNGYVLEPIVVMERHIGRLMRYYGFNKGKNEVVHHINERKNDNRIENLQLMTNSEHLRYHRQKNSRGKKNE